MSLGFATALSFSIYHFSFFIFHFSLCNLGVLCAFVVSKIQKTHHHRDAEISEAAQRKMENEKWKMIYGK